MLVLIATHVEKYNGKVTGVRLFDVDSKAIKDIGIDNALSVMAKDANSDLVYNVKAQGNELVGLNGKLDRYSQLVGNKQVGLNPLVILKEYLDGSYDVCDYRGNTERVGLVSALKYINSEGIANGKVVVRNGKEFISSISGEYPKEEVADVKLDAMDINSSYALVGKQEYKVTDDGEFYVLDKNIQTKVINVPYGVTSIRYRGLSGCMNVEKVILPVGLKKIGIQAFSDCKNLVSVILPLGLEEIACNAFSECIKLKSIDIPTTCKVFGLNIFIDCRRLKTVNVGDRSSSLKSSMLPAGVRLVYK